MNYASFRGSACAALLAVVVCHSNVRSATITYTGGGPDDLWTTAANWDLGVPEDDDTVNINNGTQPVEVDQTGAVARNVDIFGNGVLNVTGGQLTFGYSNNRWFWIGAGSAGTVNQSGGTIVGTGNGTDFYIDSFGTYNMTGGTLDTPNDLFMYDGAVLSMAGQSNIIIGDDFKIKNKQSVTLQIDLVGDTAPLIVVGDDLDLKGDLNLSIDTSLWTGGEDFDLFQVDGSIKGQGQFATVTIDGVPQDPADYQFSNGSVTVPVSEPSARVLGGLAICCLLLGSTPAFGRRIRNGSAKSVSQPHLSRRNTGRNAGSHKTPSHRSARLKHTLSRRR